MAEMMGAFMTQKGWELLAKKQIGIDNTKFTRMAAGSGNEYEGMTEAEIREAIRNSETLLHEECSFPFTDVDIINGTTVNIIGTLTNEFEDIKIEKGFFVTQVGVFANDPDEGEILYIVLQFKVENGVSADYMPAHDGKGPSTITYAIYTNVADAEKVDITINSSVYLNADIFYEYKQKTRVEFDEIQRRLLEIEAGSQLETIQQEIGTLTENLSSHVEERDIHTTIEEKARIQNNSDRIDALYDTLISGDFSLHIDFITLDVVDLEKGLWNREKQRVEC